MKLHKRTTREIFSLQLTASPDSLVYVAHDNSFALFDGVVAGTIMPTADNSSLPIVQKYSRGTKVLHKYPGRNYYVELRAHQAFETIAEEVVGTEGINNGECFLCLYVYI